MGNAEPQNFLAWDSVEIGVIRVHSRSLCLDGFQTLSTPFPRVSFVHLSCDEHLIRSEIKLLAVASAAFQQKLLPFQATQEYVKRN